jgi:DNA primase
MKNVCDISPLKQIPIIEVAKRLGISVRGTKAMCFTGHDKASPSLSFLKSRNTWRCFGACGKHGDGIALVMEKQNLDFKSALTWFAQNFGVDVRPPGTDQRETLPAKPKSNLVAEQETQQKETEFAADAEMYAWLIHHCPPVSSPKGLDYLAGHGITLECANRFNLRELTDPQAVFGRLVEQWGAQRVYRSGLTWGKDGIPERLIWRPPALLFPFRQNGSVIYLQARMFDSDRKYLNPRGIAKPLFNLDRLTGLPAESLIHICEGVPDTLAMEAHELNAVGVLGATSFRPEWVDPFLKFKLEVLGQGDAAGAKFAADISLFFRTRGKSVRDKRLPEGKDVADIFGAGEKI